MSENITITHEDTSHLTKREKLFLRDEKILELRESNYSYDDIAKIYRISDRQVRRIIDNKIEAEKQLIEEKAKHTTVSAYLRNTKSIQQDFEKCIKIIDKIIEPLDKIRTLNSIIDLKIKFSKMAVECDGILAVKQMKDELDQLIEDATTNQ